MNGALITDNIGLVHFFAGPFRHRQDYEDIISAGISGLAKAASVYDEAKGKFSVYARNWVKARILYYVTKAPTIRGSVNNAGKDALSVTSLDVTSEDSDTSWAECIADPHNYADDVFNREIELEVRAIVDAADDIPPNQRAALLRVLDGAQLNQLEQTHLFHFRRAESRSARKIKELLHDYLTA